MESVLLLTVRGGATSRDQSWWEDALKKNPLYLQIMSREAQLLYPTTVVEAFVTLASAHPSRDQILRIASNIVPEIWDNRENVLQWYRAGLPFLVNLHPKDDKEICLLIAQRCTSFLTCSFRQAASLSLRNDKCFMQLIIKHNATLISCASHVLQGDFDVALSAFARLSFLELVNFIEDGDRHDLAEAFITKAKDMLTLREDFIATILCGVNEEPSLCAMLNQGTETSIAHKKKIAYYLGVPSGEQLTLIRRACKNVSSVLEDRLSQGY